MANAADSQELLLQNLHDAGCDDALIQKCVERYHAQDAPEMIALLRAYKRKLLDELHLCQREIDSLDYLIFRLEHGNQAGVISL